MEVEVEVEVEKHMLVYYYGLIMLIFSLIILISCKALSFINKYLSSHFYIRISTLILLYCSFLNYNTLDLSEIFKSGIGIYGGLYHVSLTTQIMELFLFIVSFLILTSWPVKHCISSSPSSSFSSSSSSSFSSIEGETSPLAMEQNSFLNNSYYVKKNSINYSIIILFSCLGASLLISSWDLISMYISIELQSFSLYVLSTLYKDSETSTSAGLKYFLLGGLASCLILLGSAFIYTSIGLTNFESIFNLLSVHVLYELLNFQLGLFIIFVGFLIKIAAAPLHNWSPAERYRKTLFWDKLPNSGDTLKLMVPNHSWKIMSGWTNYSGMVISYKIYENIMGYHGSKSNFILNL